MESPHEEDRHLIPASQSPKRASRRRNGETTSRTCIRPRRCSTGNFDNSPDSLSNCHKNTHRAEFIMSLYIAQEFLGVLLRTCRSDGDSSLFWDCRHSISGRHSPDFARCERPRQTYGKAERQRAVDAKSRGRSNPAIPTSCLRSAHSSRPKRRQDNRSGGRTSHATSVAPVTLILRNTSRVTSRCI